MITRSAFGRIANLGDLYDVRTDNFCGSSIFLSPLPEESAFVKWIDENFSDVTILNDTSSSSSSLAPLLDSLGHASSLTPISQEEKLSYLAGLIHEGARFLPFGWHKRSKMTRKTVSMSIVRRTQCLNLLEPRVRSNVTPASVEEMSPTHVVVQIKWGVSLEGILDFDPTLLLQSPAGVSGKEVSRSESKNFVFRLFGNFDLNNCTTTVPNTFAEALKIWEKISIRPNPVGSENLTQNGRPLAYGLMPLRDLQKFMIFHNVPPAKLQRTVPIVPENEANEIISIFEEIFALHQNLQDWLSTSLEGPDEKFLPTKILTETRDLVKNLGKGHTKFKSDFAIQLLAHRLKVIKEDKTKSHFSDPIAKYRESAFCARKIQSVMEKLEKIWRDKMTLVNIFKNKGATVLPKTESLIPFIIGAGEPSHVFYYRETINETEKDKLMEELGNFVELIGEKIFQNPQTTQKTTSSSSSLPAGTTIPPTFQHGPRGPCHTTPPSIFQQTSLHSLEAHHHDDDDEELLERVKKIFVAVDTDVHPELAISEGFAIFRYEKGKLVSRHVKN